MKVTSNFEPSVGSITSRLQGTDLASLDNSSFCDYILKVEKDDGQKYSYNGGGYASSSELVYAVPGTIPEAEEKEEESSENVVINLLMQLQAFQNNDNTIVRNSEMVKNQIIKQLQVESAGLSQGNLKNQIMKVSNQALKGKLSDSDYRNVVNLISKTIKKKTVNNENVTNNISNNISTLNRVTSNNLVASNNYFENFEQNSRVVNNNFSTSQVNNFRYAPNVNYLSNLNIRETFLNQIAKDYITVNENPVNTPKSKVLQGREIVKQDSNEAVTDTRTIIKSEKPVTVENRTYENITEAVYNLSKLVFNKTQRSILENKNEILRQINEDKTVLRQSFSTNRNVHVVNNEITDTYNKNNILYNFKNIIQNRSTVTNLFSEKLSKKSPAPTVLINRDDLESGSIETNFTLKGKDKVFENKLLNRLELSSTFTNTTQENQEIQTYNNINKKNVSLLNRNFFNQINEISKTQNEKFLTQILDKAVVVNENVTRRKELVNVQKERILNQQETENLLLENTIENAQFKTEVTNRVKNLENAVTRFVNDRVVLKTSTLENITRSADEIIDKKVNTLLNKDIVSSVNNIINKKLTFVKKQTDNINQINDTNIVNVVNKNTVNKISDEIRKKTNISTLLTKNVFEDVQNKLDVRTNVLKTENNVVNNTTNTRLVHNLTVNNQSENAESTNEEIVETRKNIFSKDIDKVTRLVNENRVNLNRIVKKNQSSIIENAVKSNLLKTNDIFNKTTRSLVTRTADVRKTDANLKSVELINRKNITREDLTEETVLQDTVHNTIETLEKAIKENTDVIKNVVNNKTISILQPDVKKLIQRNEVIKSINSKHRIADRTSRQNIENEINNQNVRLKYLYNENLIEQDILRQITENVTGQTTESRLFNLVENYDDVNRTVNVKRKLNLLRKNAVKNIDEVSQNRVLTVTKGLTQRNLTTDQIDNTDVRLVNLNVSREDEIKTDEYLIHQDGVSHSAQPQHFASAAMVYREPVTQTVFPQEALQASVQRHIEEKEQVLKEQARREIKEEYSREKVNKESELTEEKVNRMIEFRANEIARKYFKSIDIDGISREIISNIERSTELQRRRFGI